MSKIGTLKITIEFIFYWILINFYKKSMYCVFMANIPLNYAHYIS